MTIIRTVIIVLSFSIIEYAQSSGGGDRVSQDVVDASASSRTLLPDMELLPNLPMSCTAGQQYFSPTTKSKYLCTSTNRWTPQATSSLAGTFYPVALYVSGNIGQDNANFVWDASNHRLGLGTSSPAYRLDLSGGSMRLNSGTTGVEAFTLAGGIGVGIPVPYFAPATAAPNSVIAFDLYPKGTPSNFTGNTGVAWFDLCSTAAGVSGYECLRMGKFANGDAHVSAAKGGSGTVRNLDLQINGGRVGIGTTSPAALLSVGSSSPFQVNGNGNIAKLNNVPTNFPSANAPGYLTNDGRGNFFYTPVNSLTAMTAAALPVAPPVGTIAKVSDGASISDCTSGSGTIARSCRWNGSTWEFAPVGGYVLSSQPGFIPAKNTSFAAPAIASVASVEGARQYVVAKACQISNMYMNLGADQPASGSINVTLRVATGGAAPVDTSVTATVPAGAPAGTVVFDTAHNADLAPGDLISIKVVNEAAAPGNLLTINFYCAY